jgi:putative ATP-binding cassette transporter
LSRLVGDIWRLSIPYFRSEDRGPGLLLLAAVIAIELSIVLINVLINQWNARFFNALQDHNWNSFVSEIWIFSGLAAIFVVLAVYQLYLNQWLQIRWRTWMTTRRGRRRPRRGREPPSGRMPQMPRRTARGR